MAELARVAGVDVSTVSRALNDSPLIKKETKEQVRKIASELGYAINAAARNLRIQSSESIGIVIPIRPDSGQTLSDPFFLEMVASVSMAAAARDYDLIIHIPHGDQQVNEERLLQTGKADGLIVIGQAERTTYLNELGDLGKKIVVWGGAVDNVNYTLVGSDNLQGGYAATKHLLDLGRKDILFVGDIDLPEVTLRFQGYEKAFKEAGLKVNSDLLVDISLGADASSIHRSIELKMKQGLRFNSVFAVSDRLAICVMDALRSAGRTVPHDVSVVGYDNIDQAALAHPALTTIDQHITDGAKMMVDMLLDKLAGSVVNPKMTETSLVIRESTIAI